ncbi:MAG: hypothetical protein U5N86_08945 [Planctomycetota bacterium]|nr:hypothetical protein [Planctomycetota bacterium]
MAKRKHKNSKDLKWVHEKLKTAFGDKVTIPERNVLDELVYNLLLQGSTKKRAQKAFDALKNEFHDWNEVRVTVPQTIAATIKGVGLEHVKSLRLVKILQGIFDDRSEWNLEFLNEMNTESVPNLSVSNGRYRRQLRGYSFDFRAGAGRISLQQARSSFRSAFRFRP